MGSGRGRGIAVAGAAALIALVGCAAPTAGTAVPAPVTAPSAASISASEPAGSLSSSTPPPAAYVPAVAPTPPPPSSGVPDPTPTPVSAATPEPAPPAEPAPEPAPAPAPWSEASDDDIRGAAASAVAVTERFWAESFAGRVGADGSPEAWSAPELWNGDGFYDSDTGSVADCGDGKNYTANAFFCGNATDGTGFLAWDLQFFHQHQDLGRTMVFMVIAHETGHAVQARLVHDGVDGALFDGSKRYELQADCFGGAALGKAVRDGYLTLPATAPDEMVAMATAFGGDPAGHGDPDERDTSFQRGFASGDMNTCLIDPAS